MAFDPDKFLQETAPIQAAQAQDQGFDPDAFLAETAPTSNEPVTVNPNREASLGFFNRARYAIEPLESNRMALLVQEFGEENVKQDDKGNLFVKQGNQFRPVNEEGFSFADVADFAGAIPEAAGGLVGAVGGGIVGAGVGSIPAAAGLGAAGGLVGSGVRQSLSALLGTPQVATVRERFAEGGLSALTGGLFGGGAQALKVAAPSIKSGAKAVGGGIKSAFEKVPGVKTAEEFVETSAKTTKGVIDSIGKTFSIKKAEDADELLKIADKFNIDKTILPEAVEFGDKSLVSRVGRVVAEGPYGEQKLENFARAHAQVSTAIDDAIGRVAPYRPTSKVEAGQFIIDSVNDAKTVFFDNLEETYTNVVKNAPGLKLSPESQKRVSSKLLGIERFAKGRVERGIGSQKQEAKSLLEAVSTLKNTNSSLKQTVEALRNIGEEAFRKGSNQNRLPIDQKRLQQLYFDLQKEVIETVRSSYGDDVAENLVRNNKMISDFLGEESILSKVIGKEGVAPENVFKSLVENGDTRKIEALMSIMPPDKVPSIKASLLDSLIKRNEDGFVMFQSTANALKNKKDILNKLFTPEEMADVAQLLRLGRRMGNPIMSTSGTGASNAFNDMIGKAKEAVFNENVLELAKNRGRKPPRPPIKGKSTGVRINLNPERVGAYGNILLDKTQRDGAYFTRGPSGNKSNKEKKK